MKYKLLKAIIFGFTFFGGAIPAASQQYGGCAVETLSDTPIVAVFAQFLNIGNYSDLTEEIDIYDDWSASHKRDLTENLSQLLNNRPLSSCVLFQRREYSDSFVTEIIMFKFNDTHLYLFIASAKVENEWFVARLQLESSFDKIFELIR